MSMPSNAQHFIPVLRSGSWADIGSKQRMEDEHICIDDIARNHLGDPDFESRTPMAFYGVFDGHGGRDAATYIKENLLNFITEYGDFPNGGLRNAVKNAFLKADDALAEPKSCVDMSSGTTALVAMVSGKSLLVANAGDCRAVLGKRWGRTLQLSSDHKLTSSAERKRIESLGGFVEDVYLNGELGVSRALGDWHLKGRGAVYLSPLSAEPEVQELELSEEDEFLIIASDGLWDVVSNESAVGIARRELMSNNDPDSCCRALVTEALRKHSVDNLTVVLVCFSTGPPPKKRFRNSRLRRSTNAASDL
uniref:protein-serine/threonine phosphatase n=1 Tax=Picea sitchensis TaxID=3332 RepID=A9P2D9_PICSI|nr:unknown [Picea sitchensis]